MYNVFFVEDDAPVRDAVRDNRFWQENGTFTLCGVAANGREAWEVIEHADIDIVITDIRMPIIDGLALSRLIHANRPEIRVIILTGFSEFGYAKEAMSAGVIEYVLKPLRFADLIPPIEKAAASIDAARNASRVKEQLEQQISANLALERQKLLSDMAYGAQPMDALCAGAERLGLVFQGRCVAAVVAQCGDSDNAGSDDALGELLSQSLLAEASAYIIECDRSGLAVLFTDETAPALRTRAAAYADRLAERVSEAYGRTPLRIAVGRVHAGAEGVRRSFETAKMVLPLSPLFDQQSTIDLNRPLEERVAGRDFLDANFFSAEKQCLQELVETANAGAVGSTVERISRTVYRFNTPALVFFGYLNILGYLRLLAEDYDLKADESLPAAQIGQYPPAGEFAFLLEHIADQKTINAYICRLLNALVSMRRGMLSRRNTQIIAAVKAYVEENYCNTGLSLSGAGAYVGLSNNYLSTLFRKECGETFSAYVTRLRVKKAAEILAGSEKNVTDIAFEVGFSDPNYFSRVFRRQTGHSPLKYKKAHRKR